jgi:hypothetical protein
MSSSTQALGEATRRRHENAEKAVQGALREARKTLTPVTVTGIAAAAGVSTDFIYRHPELRAQVEALRRSRSAPHTTSGDDHDVDAAASTLVRRLSQQLADGRRKHREEVAELKYALEAAHGQLLELRRQLQASS